MSEPSSRKAAASGRCAALCRILREPFEERGNACEGAARHGPSGRREKALHLRAPGARGTSRRSRPVLGRPASVRCRRRQEIEAPGKAPHVNALEVKGIGISLRRSIGMAIDDPVVGREPSRGIAARENIPPVASARDLAGLLLSQRIVPNHRSPFVAEDRHWCAARSAARGRQWILFRARLGPIFLPG